MCSRTPSKFFQERKAAQFTNPAFRSPMAEHIFSVLSLTTSGSTPKLVTIYRTSRIGEVLEPS